MKKPYLNEEENQAKQDESNHHRAERESLSVQERFVRMEISFALTKNGGSMPIGLGGRSFPVVRLAGWLAGWLAGRQTKFSLGC